MKKFDQENKILEEVKNENLVSYAARALRAKITFADNRLTIVNGMIMQAKDLKVAVSPSKLQLEREEYQKSYQGIRALIEKKSKGKDVSKVASQHSKSTIRVREGYNIIQP